jgi:hypothetical protein
MSTFIDPGEPAVATDGAVAAATPVTPVIGAIPTLPRAARRPSGSTVKIIIVTAAWVGVVIAASALRPVSAVRPYALFAHLIFLAVSFGAVLAVELHGLGWLLRLVSLDRVASLALSLDPMIWLGLAGLTASGLLLGPHVDRPLTLVKLVLVLLVALNGLRAAQLGADLRGVVAAHAASGGLGRPRVPLRLLARSASVSLVSQLGWWGAALIGFLTTSGALPAI